MSTLVTNIINNVFNAVWFCCIAAEPKHSRRKTILIVAGTAMICQGIAFLLFYLRTSDVLFYRSTSPSVMYLVGYLSGMIIYAIMFCFLVSDSHPFKSLFLVSGYFSLWGVIYGIISIVTNTYAGAGNAAIWALRVGLNLVVLILYLLFFRDRLFWMYKEIKSGYGMISVLSIMCFFMQTLFLFYNQKMRSHDPFFVVLLISAFGFTVAVYAMIFRYMAQSDHTGRMKQLQANEKFLLAQIDSYEKMAESARQTRHDFRHHSMVIMEYARKKDHQGILAYLQEYEEKEAEKYAATFCKNHAVDTVLSAYVNRCGQNGIEVSTDIRLEETGNISDYDLVTILANILENAVNGCMQADIGMPTGFGMQTGAGMQTDVVMQTAAVMQDAGDSVNVKKKPKLEISIRQKDNKMIMVCKNTCARDIRFENGLPKNRERAGIGVESILNTAAKYGGVADFSASDGIFVCRVILSSR